MKRALDGAALALSVVVSPYLVTAVTTVLVTFAYTRPGVFGLIQTFICVTCSAGVPLLFTLWRVRTGAATDLHATLRRQRHPIFAVAIVSTAFATWLMWLTSAHALIVAMGISYCINGVALWLISAFWKISLHSSVLAGAIVLGVFAFGVSAVVWFFLLPPVAWARVHRGRHTVAQVTVGALSGALLTWWVLRLAG